MATLKGQNLRIITTPTGGHAANTVVAMATNCTINLITNTDDSSTKDDVGMARKPLPSSLSWNVQVESMDVLDLSALLGAIKSLQLFTLVWDETSTSDNTTALGASFARTGQAYIADLTATFNDRETSTKNIQFQGTGAIESLDSAVTVGTTIDNAYTKGQFVRLFLGGSSSVAPNKVIGAAKQLQLHISMGLEDATTKDTEGHWVVQEPTELSYDITTQALVRSNDTITSSVDAQAFSDMEDLYEAGAPISWKIAGTSGDNNRTAMTTICSGNCIIQNLTLNGPNRQKATYQATLAGYGEYSVGQ